MKLKSTFQEDMRLDRCVKGKHPYHLETESKWIKSEPDCECGTKERHTHCHHCGFIVSIGDWESEGILIGTIRL